jgi:hypothetical protein
MVPLIVFPPIYNKHVNEKIIQDSMNALILSPYNFQIRTMDPNVQKKLNKYPAIIFISYSIRC